MSMNARFVFREFKSFWMKLCWSETRWLLTTLKSATEATNPTNNYKASNQEVWDHLVLILLKY